MENSFQKVKELPRFLLDIVYPPRCLFCQKELEREKGEEAPLCPACQKVFPATGENGYQEGENFRYCRSAVYYTDLFRDSFHRYKFRSRWHYSEIYGQWMWEHFRQFENDRDRFDCVSWAPLSLPRYLSRGYDQSRRLAAEFCRHSGMTLTPLLRKRRHIAPQSGMENAEQRRKNIKNVYVLRHSADVVGKRILLVDDIITTGSTLEEASRVLMEGGAAEVCCLTLARSIR